MTKHVAIITARAKPGELPKVFRAWREHLEVEELKDTGVERMVLFVDDEDHDTMHVWGLYASRGDFDKNLVSVQIQKFLESCRPYLRDDPDLIGGVPVWAKRVEI